MREITCWFRYSLEHWISLRKHVENGRLGLDEVLETVGWINGSSISTAYRGRIEDAKIPSTFAAYIRSV